VSDRPPARGERPAEAARPRRRPRPASPPDILYHATTLRRIDKLRRAGTLDVRGGRPVYLSRHEAQAWHVAHRQGEEPAVLIIDVARAMRDGCRFERNGQGLWQVAAIPVRHVLNLRDGYAEQVSAGGIPVWFGPRGPELALIRVQRRSGLTWEVAKGKLEDGEAPAEAAAREVNEEMGCAMALHLIAPLGSVRYGFTTPDGSPRLKTLHMFLFRTPERESCFLPSDREGVREVGWFSVEEAARLVTHRSLRPLMIRLCEEAEVEDGMLSGYEPPAGAAR